MEKIAIRGDEKNSRKIIEYFESIGKNRYHWYGNANNLYYYINSDNEIDSRNYPPEGYTLYESWCEFEKKNKMGKRHIEITIEKAKEWYKQGGELREVALQAFDEDELKYELEDKFPASWGEFLYSEGYRYCSINNFRTSEEAKAFVALSKLIQLRDEYWKLDNNWEPNWINKVPEIPLQEKFSIHVDCGEVKKGFGYLLNHILIFRTSDLRDKFYDNFKDLIEEAKMFL